MILALDNHFQLREEQKRDQPDIPSPWGSPIPIPGAGTYSPCCVAVDRHPIHPATMVELHRDPPGPKETEWIELRLCGSYSREIESGDPQVFFLPQTETALSNLPRVRHQIREIISNTLLWSQAMLHFRLAIYLHGKGPLSSPVHTTSTRWSGASATSNLLDPEWFVLNIDANFDSRASSVAEKEGGMDKLQ
ncbi:hypothetical protein N7468_009833 [Penicillium chermesinum]|uniref:Uncharacterized protein n=1 Tax=Penicillium chermesinum TaxID=63820 RepID=A0A9W9NBI7_9EURO|nr:uncharacterized protein N7468_009833 [Penicillium chermesinum]KAJ5216825.1 hypothetical protein N7468_009833 [Penicillium chermesinum]